MQTCPNSGVIDFAHHRIEIAVCAFSLNYWGTAALLVSIVQTTLFVPKNRDTASVTAVE